MFTVTKIYYRIFQFVFNICARLLPWRKAKIEKGADAIRRIPKLLSTSKLSRPMLVTDEGLIKAGVTQRVLDVLNENDVSYVLYSNVTPNPSVNTVNEIYDIYIKNRCDSFIPVGGGSVIDASKAAAARVARPQKSVQKLGGLLKVLKKIPTIIAVPTTAGTGSETTIASLITDTDTHHKYAIMDLALIPRYAILDPTLTIGLPPHITGTTGMDALTHAVEAYLCWTYNTKESLRFAEEATRLIFENLLDAYEDGTNLKARENMLQASYMAGFAFTRAGVGNIHAIAHTLGGLYNTPHGLANAVILPVVLEDYGEKIYRKLATLATIAKVSVGTDDAENAKAFIAAIRELNNRMNIGRSFNFILEKDIPQMVSWASKEANPLYPVPVIYDKDRFINIIFKISS